MNQNAQPDFTLFKNAKRKRLLVITCLTVLVLSSITFGFINLASNHAQKAHAASSCTPQLASVSSFAATQTQNVRILGSCFGTGNTSSNSNTPYFKILINNSTSSSWAACHMGTSPYEDDGVTCNVSSWTDTSITFAGFTGAYGQNGWTVNPGDALLIQVWNPQTSQGPGTCTALAGGSPTNCSVPPDVTFADQNWNCSTAACTKRVAAGALQPNYQCAEFVARSLAYAGLLPGLAPNSAQSAYQFYQSGKTYDLLLISPVPGYNTLATYLRDFGLADNIGHNLSNASAGDLVVFLKNGKPTHIEIITTLGSSTSQTLLDAHNKARYHVALSNQIKGFSSWYILHI